MLPLTSVDLQRMMIRVNILHAPPPDGDDASAIYASRASDFFLKQNGDTSCAKVMLLGHVGPLTVNEDGAGLPWRSDVDTNTTSSDKDSTATGSLTLFLISCAADGSVDRSVRKIMRKLKAADATSKSTADAAATATSRCRYAVAAIGHARCENSANQMADTIFGTGRRFDKALAGSGLFVDNNGGTSSIGVSILETQAELCGPETEFDPWLELLLRKIVDESSK